MCPGPDNWMKGSNRFLLQFMLFPKETETLWSAKSLRCLLFVWGAWTEILKGSFLSCIAGRRERVRNLPSNELSGSFRGVPSAHRTERWSSSIQRLQWKRVSDFFGFFHRPLAAFWLMLRFWSSCIYEKECKVAEAQQGWGFIVFAEDARRWFFSSFSLFPGRHASSHSRPCCSL